MTLKVKCVIDSTTEGYVLTGVCLFGGGGVFEYPMASGPMYFVEGGGYNPRLWYQVFVLGKGVHPKPESGHGSTPLPSGQHTPWTGYAAGRTPLAVMQDFLFTIMHLLWTLQRKKNTECYL